jgi:hypothetical protein
MSVTAKFAAGAMKRGEKYKWRYQDDIMVYLGYNFSGNGYWHQFRKIGDSREVWCEVRTDDLQMIEEVKDD